MEIIKENLVSIILGVVTTIISVMLYKLANKHRVPIDKAINDKLHFILLNLTSDNLKETNHGDFKDEFVYNKDEVRVKLLKNYSGQIRILKQAQIDTISGDYFSAIQNYDLFLERSRKDHPAYIEKAYALVKIGDYDKAEEIYLQQISFNPKNEIALLNYGVVLIEKKEFKRAIDILKKAIKINPNSSTAFSHIGVAYANLNDMQAIQNFNITLNIDKRNLTAIKNKAIFLNQINDYDASVNCFKLGIQIAPDMYELLSGISAPLTNSGREKDAITYCDKAIAINPKDYRAYSNKGFAFSKLGLYEDAEINYLKSFEINPQYDHAMFNLALLLYDNDRIKEAIEINQKALNIKPNEEKYKNLARELQQQWPSLCNTGLERPKL